MVRYIDKYVQQRQDNGPRLRIWEALCVVNYLVLEVMTLAAHTLI